ncbi:MAG: outer membrane beta-barrel domain-containing protein [Myxococcaceae bacterium]
MTRTIFIAALVFATVSQAAPASFIAKQGLFAQTLGQTGGTTTKSDDDEDEDETPKPLDKQTGTKDVKKPTEEQKKDAPEQNAVGTPNAPAVPPGAPSNDTQKLVSGAPLYNPNVAVHIVEKKVFSDKGHSEIVLYPAWVQVNGKFTNHAGTALTYLYHLQENFALTVNPLYNWYNSESGFNQELIDKARVEAQAATSLLLNYGATAGVEVTPLYGKFAFYEGSLAHFSFILNGGAGIGSTRHQLKPFSETSGPATYGDTGFKFLGQVGGGFRVQFGSRFALRLEVRDLVYTARVDSVNGCSLDDLQTIKAKTDAGGNQQSLGTLNLSKGCKFGNFGKNGSDLRSDVNLARNLVATPSSDVLNNVGFYLGAGFIF